MKVLLCLPPGGYLVDKDELMPAAGLPPLGLASLAAVLEEAGLAVEVLDAQAENLSWPRIRARLSRTVPEVVGVTFTTESRAGGFRLIREARRALPAALVLAGGPHVTFAAKDTLDHIPELDAVCRGEGEFTLLEAVRARQEGRDFADVAGLSWRREGRIVHNPPRPFITDLDALPPPARHRLPLERYAGFTLDLPDRGRTRFASLMASRGCPVGCCFCSASAMWGRRFRPRSAAAVVDEVEELVRRHGIGGIWFFDDSFTMDKDRVHAICDALLLRNLDLAWYCDSRVDRVEEELLRKMKRAGCRGISFGVETGSERLLAEVLGKHITLDQVRRVRDLCRTVGLRPRWLFMVGLPTETREEAGATLALMAELGGDSSLGVLKIYPGTKVERWAREEGILPADFSWTDTGKGKAFSMPLVTGDAPLYLDRMTWKDIARILLRYAEMNNYPLRSRILPALRRVRSPRELLRLLTMGLVYAGHRLGRGAR